ncbi:CGNR zinc finger domain-containing protein [Streptomyces sp. NPDC002845]
MASGTVSSAYAPGYEPRFDCGRLCLDLLATAHPDEQLYSAERLWAWVVGAGLVPEGTPPAGGDADVDASWLVGFRELRGHIGQLVRSEPGLDSRPFDISLARVNELARTATPAPRAVRTAEGSLVRVLDGAPGVAALLAVIARDTVELLTDPVACGSLRECEGDSCSIVYLDTSRGRRRRWCSSEVCGNRERVARHRRRAALARV